MPHPTAKHWIIALSLIGSCAAVGCSSGSKAQNAEAERASLTATSEEGEDEARGGNADATDTEEASFPVVATGPVAVIDGEEIGQEQFNDLIKRRMNNQRDVPYRVAQIHMHRTLRQLIDDHLITRRLDEQSVTVSDETVEEAHAEFREKFPNENAYESFLERADLTPERMKAEMRKSERLEKHLKQVYGIGVSEKQARAYYDENPAEFEKLERVEASHILIKVEPGDEESDAEKRAAELSERARAGADFAKLAEEYSEGPSGKKGGELGYFPKGRMVPKFEKAAFSMKAGDISEPVKTRFGYHVIKVTDRKAAGKQPFADVKDELIERLERQELKESMETLIAELREKATIEQKPDNIEIRIEEPDPDSQQSGPGGVPPEVREKIRKQMEEQKEEQQQDSETE